jgi:hypothetical protein
VPGSCCIRNWGVSATVGRAGCGFDISAAGFLQVLEALGQARVVGGVLVHCLILSNFIQLYMEVQQTLQQYAGCEERIRNPRRSLGYSVSCFTSWTSAFLGCARAQSPPTCLVSVPFAFCILLWPRNERSMTLIFYQR